VAEWVEAKAGEVMVAAVLAAVTAGGSCKDCAGTCSCGYNETHLASQMLYKR
jgi:D-tyrosyl-tRNA(Tyr) deacylase